MKLNLGCGNDIRHGWKNYDLYPTSDKVQKLDLTQLPLPFEDDSVDEILLSHTFEHLTVNQYSFMKELSRILKKDGRLIICVPVNHQCVEHETSLFTTDYFDGLKTKLYGNLFHNIKIKYKPNSFKNCIMNLRKMMIWITKKEVTYKMEKK